MIDGRVRAVVSLGGNLVRAVPDRLRTEPAWRNLSVTVNIATKLNRSHLINGRQAWLSPCLSRIKIDPSGSHEQFASMEDSTARFHGRLPPARVEGVGKPAIKSFLTLDFGRCCRVGLQD